MESRLPASPPAFILNALIVLICSLHASQCISQENLHEHPATLLSVGEGFASGNRAIHATDERSSLDNRLETATRSQNPQPSFISARSAVEVCANTAQGRYLIADDKGYVCPVLRVNRTTGCCPRFVERSSKKAAMNSAEKWMKYDGHDNWPVIIRQLPRKRYGCSSCNMTMHCCEMYERCVACCQHPHRTPPLLATSTPAAAQPAAEPFASVFEMCRDRCRHNSRSVVHENTYGSRYHHCFTHNLLESEDHAAKGAYAKEKIQKVLNSLGEKSLEVAVGALGESCDKACASKGLKVTVDICTVSISLYACNMMRLHVSPLRVCPPSPFPPSVAIATRVFLL